MIRVGRFDVDARDARAVEHLARTAWVPRRRAEAWATRVLAALPGIPAPLVPLLGSPDAAEPAAPAHGEALEAAQEVTGTPVESPLAMLPAPSSASPRRMLWLWVRGQETLHSIAKVAPAGRAAALAAEAGALRRLHREAPAELKPLLPPLVAFGEHAGLRVLALGVLPGQPLLRVHRLAPPLTWDEATLAACGRALGALHAATWREGQALLHGDAWSRNVLVRDARVTGLVDWEACVEGDPASEAAGFLRLSARADAAGRGPAPEGPLASWPAGARAFASAWSGAVARPTCTTEAVERLLLSGSPP